ncbi:MULTISPECIES: ParA family protein [unclassified Ruegeria]|uniref:ParA family protein n=1 Tax=unclassified Ruegeria TaxID=2625375 RepID=UPI001489B216|nr:MULTISPECIES: AAA family ATPase [unclassified Ruegeria]NOD75190.1 AAA family ATPase [Ruegeria sp. HKCCD4332]NOD87151.1 AAA family ATPase [Ruegeria sp. HKCCD4318]NOE12706.1 AAA family ATPase [Ruegeria sp. HKCCD4318-2]NOG09129.1 AAA family ATPase [Ruegeria sp. HKCCD4315]
MKIIACYSNKGGVGKTATSVNLAYAYAQAGKQVLLCDLDPQGASGFYFRVKPSKKLTDARFFEDVDRFIKAIRASDFEGLDVLPANLTFRDFDVFLSRMRNKRSRLKKALVSAGSDYDVIILDCPPNFSTLSENIFKAADEIVVPVIPTTLSERTFDQLVSFFDEHKLRKKKLRAFFSMVQQRKVLHQETMLSMRKLYPKRFLQTTVPFAADIEKMGQHRAPVSTYAGRSVACASYRALFEELENGAVSTQ